MAERRVGESEDATLVRAVAHGSEEALAALYDRHVDGVHAVALRLTSDRQVAEEVVQETFLALWNRAELFDPALASLATWLRTIARNRTVDRLRAAGRRPPLVSLGGRGDADELRLGVRPARTRRDRHRRRRAGSEPGSRGRGGRHARGGRRRPWRTMPEPERVVIVLAYREGLTQAEIAERLEWPLGTVKTRTRRALAHLRVALEGDHVAGRQPAGRIKRWMVMEHAEALERIEMAAVEPDGLERLMAGDTPDAAAVAGHLAGCPSCADELVADPSHVVGRARGHLRAEPDPALRDRTLAFVQAVGRERTGVTRRARRGRRDRGAAGRGDRRAAVRRRRAPVRRPPTRRGAAGRCSGSPPRSSIARRRRLRCRRRRRQQAEDDRQQPGGRDPQRRRPSRRCGSRRAAGRRAGRAHARRRPSPARLGTLLVLGHDRRARGGRHRPRPPRPPNEEYGCWVEVNGQRDAPRPDVLGGRRLDLGGTRARGSTPSRPARRSASRSAPVGGAGEPVLTGSL